MSKRNSARPGRARRRQHRSHRARGRCCSRDEGTLPGLAPSTPAVYPSDADDRVRAVLAAAGPDGMTAARLADLAHVARSTVGKASPTSPPSAPRGARPAASSALPSARPPALPGGGVHIPANAPASGPGEAVNGPDTAVTSPCAAADDPQPGTDVEDSARDAGPSAPVAPDTPIEPDQAADSAPVDATVPTAAAPDPAPESPGTAVRLGSGALGQLVLDHVTSNPAQALTPGEIGRAIGGRSSGAVANACDKLTVDGLVEPACERPRRFRVVSAASAPATDFVSASGAEAEQPIAH